MNELTTIFEGQEVIIKTDKGNKLINLVSTAKSCGLVRVGNTGLPKVRWDDVRKKLHLIQGSLRDESSTPKETELEIQYILDEIENTDDRNSIYMSSWLSKRLALECHSEKAMRYKSFLVTMDEARENVQSVGNLAEQQAILQLAQSMQGIGTVVQGMQTAMINIESYVKDSIQSKDLQIDQAMSLVGLRSINTKRITDKLREVLIYKTGAPISASSTSYIKAKNQIFKQFKVTKWEDIPVGQYNAVHAFIDEL